jgi:hypothetical protein
MTSASDLSPAERELLTLTTRGVYASPADRARAILAHLRGSESLAGQEVRKLPTPADGCTCTPHSQDAGGGYTEHLLEYDPACPEHSEHVYDPHAGAWVKAPGRTLVEAAAEFELHVEDGIHCPVCGRYGKVYRRPLNSSQARKLIAAYRRHGDAWFNLPALLADLKLPGRDESALRYFRLLEDSLEVRADGGRAGVWRVTDKGAAFVRETLKVPRYAVVRNGSVLRLEGEDVGIRDVLGAGFDLHELMAS